MVFAFVARPIYTKKRGSDGSVLVEFDGLLEKGAEARGIAVGREAHDLVFVRVEIESEVQSDRGIEDADGIAGRHFLQLFQFSVAGMIDRGALHFAHAVDDENQALLPPRAKISACGMS